MSDCVKHFFDVPKESQLSEAVVGERNAGKLFFAVMLSYAIMPTAPPAFNTAKFENGEGCGGWLPQQRALTEGTPGDILHDLRKRGERVSDQST